MGPGPGRSGLIDTTALPSPLIGQNYRFFLSYDDVGRSVEWHGASSRKL